VNRELSVLENDLSSLGPTMRCLSDLDLKIAEISKQTFEDHHLKYPSKSRYLKTINNLSKGYRSFVITKDNDVIGDLWVTNTEISKTPAAHPDLEWLKLDLGEEDVYGWDMYVRKNEESGSAAIFLMSHTLHCLRERGFKRVCGFVFVDNSAASFFYKLFRFKELRRLKADRVLFFRRVKN